ncbi:MAG: TOBE domain-containing protein, partial [Parvibaculaceae bacterium]
RGRVSQIAGPSELYEQPASRFVADFIGKVNLIEAKVASTTGNAVSFEAKSLGQVSIPHEGPATGDVALAVRPEKLEVSREKPAGDRIAAHGKVRDVAYYGDTSHVFVSTDGGLELMVNVKNDRRKGAGIEPGEALWISWAPEDTLVLTQ